MANPDITAADLKKCSCCGEEKPRSEFYKCAACKDGLRGECKRCVSSKQSDYNEKNADKIRAHKRQVYWQDPESRREKARKYGRENAERARERAKQWYWSNRESALESKRAYHHENAPKLAEKKRAYRLNNLGKIREAGRRFYAENKERLRPSRKAAKAMRRSAEGVVTKDDVAWLLEMQRWKCAVCAQSVKRARYHLDHIMPLAKGGTNNRDNLQVLCPSCNLSKSSKHPVDFMQQRGMLL
jgi:5-methylcytosine-specific restriction endonuclease McrA